MSRDSRDDEGDHMLGALLDTVNAALTQVNGFLRDLVTTITMPLTVTGQRLWETVRTPWELRERGRRLPADTYTGVSPALPSSAARPPAGYRDTGERRNGSSIRLPVTPQARSRGLLRSSPSEYETDDWEDDDYDYVGRRQDILKRDAEDRKKKLADLRF